MLDPRGLITVLSEQQLAALRQQTEAVLERIGFRVSHRGLQARCRRAGAHVDEASDTVRLPAPRLRELLALAPASYEIGDLAGNRHTVGGGHRQCLAIVTDPWVVDYTTGQPRRPYLADMRRHTILAQQLDPVVAVSRMDFPAADVPGPTSSLRALEEHLLHHAKHNFVLAAAPHNLRQWLELAQILGRGQDLRVSRLLSAGIAVISPLTLSDDNAELLLIACEHGVPVVPTVCPQAGSTAPYSSSGTLLQGNAEVVFMAALTQIVSPHHPFLYAFGPSVSDMRDGHDMYYTLDKVLWKYAAVQLAKSYGLPAGAECGGTMTHRYDPQSGAEGMLFMLAAYASGADMLAGIGSCYNGVGMSGEMMVIQTAWLEAARFLGRGIDTDLLAPSLASLERVGAGSHFLTDELTVERLRAGEFFTHPLLDCSGEVSAAPSLLERAHACAEDLIAGFRSPVPSAVRDELRCYFAGEYEKATR